MRTIELIDLLKAGVHFGHQRSRWNPKMREYIFTVRNGICIIDLEKTAEKLKVALAFVTDLRAKGGTLLFVGTKRQAQEIVKAAATQAGMPAVVERWVGGTFTNFATVSKIINKLTTLKADREAGRLAKYTKKERLVIDREIERLETVVGGIEQLKKLPEALFVVDVKNERTAVKEAQKVGIPIVALVDTNTNPDGIAYPIPANDDATKSIQLICDYLVEALADGAQEAETRAAKEAAQAKAAEGRASDTPAELEPKQSTV
ncbi:MAG: 30S ribosomal protein S2 [Candidatus Kerfeldbacteria bacterium]|nr:30S ribosomal protein S2 [Candidatus Kerfeldbacteria bacterium]